MSGLQIVMDLFQIAMFQVLSLDNILPSTVLVYI